MVRPPPPPPPAAPSYQAPPPRRPGLIRPAFTATAPTPPPQQPSPTPPPPQQPNPTPSPPRPTPTLTPATNVVEPLALPTPLSRRSPPSSPTTTPPPSLTTTTSPISTTRALTPPSSPPKVLKPLEQAPPQLPPTNSVTPPPRSLSPPKRSDLIPSPPSSPPHAPLMQQTNQHPLPPSSPPKTIPPTSTMHPLSPLVLPSLKHKPYDEIPPEHKQKTIHVQEPKEKPKISSTGFNGGHIGALHAHNSTRKPETHKKHWDSEDAGKNIITIAGENKGAVMNITPVSDKKIDFGHNTLTSKPKSTTSNDGETDSQAKNKNQNSNELLKTSFLNSNVQGVNNSIIFNCSINHHDPGIHLTLSTKFDGDYGFQSKEHKK